MLTALSNPEFNFPKKLNRGKRCCTSLTKLEGDNKVSTWYEGEVECDEADTPPPTPLRPLGFGRYIFVENSDDGQETLIFQTYGLWVENYPIIA